MFSKVQTIIFFFKLLILGARSRRSKRAVQPLEGDEDDEDLPRDIAASIQVRSRLFLTIVVSGWDLAECGWDLA